MGLIQDCFLKIQNFLCRLLIFLVKFAKPFFSNFIKNILFVLQDVVDLLKEENEFVD